MAVLIATVCFAMVILYSLLRPRHKERHIYILPAGPNGLPILGSLVGWLGAQRKGTLPAWVRTKPKSLNDLLITRYKLAKQAQYGEMTSLSMGNRTWVVLNTSRVVNEIIAKRASVTHERPYFPIAGGLVSRDKRLFLQKTSDWKEGRRLIYQLILGAGSKDHGPIMERATLGLLKVYLEEPEAWYAHKYRYPRSIMYQIVTARPSKQSRAELDDLQRVTSTFLTSINRSLVDLFPQIHKLPICLQF